MEPPNHQKLDHFSTEILKPMVSWRYTMTLEPPSFTADSEGKKELEWYEYPPIKQPFRVYLRGDHSTYIIQLLSKVGTAHSTLKGSSSSFALGILMLTPAI